MAIDTSASSGRRSEPATRLGTRRWLVLITLCASQFMIALDFSIVNVALPVIGRELGFASTGDLQWVITAFILPTAGLLLLFGRLSDLLGRRRLFLIGVVIFTAFSLVGGLAQTPWQLLLARAGQGLGAAMVSPTALSLLTTSFREGPERDKALGINGSLLSLGFVSGVISGGIITDGLSWRWTMLILFFIGAVVLVGAALLIEDRVPPARTKLDVPGAVLATAGLVALVYGISTGADAGWGSAQTLGVLIAGVLLLGAFFVVEARTSDPLVPLRVLARPTVKWGNLAGFITFGMCAGVTFLLTLYMQDVLRYSPTATGLGFAALGATAIIAGSTGPTIISRIGATPALVIGLVVQALSTTSMVLLPSSGDLPLLLLTTAALGFGHVLAVVSFNVIATSGVPDSEQGLAGGLVQTAQQFGGAICIPVLAAVVTGLTANGEMLPGLHGGLWVAGLVPAAGAVVAGVFLRRRVAVAQD